MAEYHHEQGPQELLDYFRSGKHTGRGPQLDEALTSGVLRALLRNERIAEAAGQKRLVARRRLTTGPLERNVDLILGAPATSSGALILPAGPTGWVEATPADVYFGLEVKSIMTEHHKAQRNRRVEFNAHALNLHAVNASAVRSGICVINAADRYASHTSPKDWNDHGDGKARVSSALRELSNVPIRTATTEVAGLDALSAVVVDVDNVQFDAAKFLSGPPAPPDGDRMSFERYIAVTSRLLVERFLT